MAGTIVVERTVRIAATPEELQRRLADLPGWVDWSPWEGLDPALDRDYTGEPGTVGSGYAWSGNRKAGAGRMQVTAVDPDGVGIALDFTKPFRSSNRIRFVLTPEGDGTRVTWRMESPKTFLSRVFNIEKLVGKDFEKGLRQLNQVVEG
ncbi:potassium-transporting ATPase subunit F [Leifsonia sp. LS1]|uniref:SRPBCC family protein n=1 Tax=Leifsonia sp. LS1 TaxID=2828483 RepID=UPI001CFDEFD1|nr:SRPBCC family protein [Leifsonia sp. LS1]GIT78663.1 potassium-transporting ATPase subunit F [Leifsonia sp. LS1]